MNTGEWTLTMTACERERERESGTCPGRGTGDVGPGWGEMARQEGSLKARGSGRVSVRVDWNESEQSGQRIEQR